MSGTKDYYQILNVSQRESQFQIRRAYRRLALQNHPDHVPPKKKEEAEKVFKEIVEAYFVIGKKERRKIYDEQRAIEQNVLLPSDAWSFVEPTQRAFNPDSFNYYFNEQRDHCDALRIDWRDVLGGSMATIAAATVFALLFSFGHGLLPDWAMVDIGDNVLLPLPALIALMYIAVQPLRDFLWEYVGEEELYDVFLLLMSWVVLGILFVILLARIWVPLVVEPEAPVPAEDTVKKKINGYDNLPVNLEVFKLTPDGKTPPIKSGGGI